MPFHDLPLDIYTTVCSFLDGLDILALGQTCSVLRAATQERTVWITALRQYIFKNQLLTGAYSSYGDWDLDLMKDVSTGPSRVLKKLSRGSLTNHSVDEPPIIEFTKKRIISADNSKMHGFSRICLIPGGRFLFAYCHPEIYVYDLDAGFKCRDEAPEILRIPCDDDWLFIPSPSADGKEIRLATAQTLLSDSGHEAEVYVTRFIMGDSNTPPTVKTMVSRMEVSHPSDPDYFTIVEDMFIYTYLDGNRPRNCVVNVWNFMEDTFASWSIPHRNYVEFYHDNGYIVMIEKNFLRGWKIPPLCPRPQGDKPIPIEIIPASFHIPIDTGGVPETEILDRPQCKRVYDWYNTFQPLEVFTFKHRDNVDFHEWTTYTIRQNELGPSSTASGVLHPKDKVVVAYPVTSKFICDPNSDGNVTSNPFFVCNDSVVRVFAHFRRPYAVLMPQMSFYGDNTADTRTERIVQLQVLEDIPLRSHLHSRVHFVFDPLSGRLAYIGERYKSVVVLDYLEHPKCLREE